MTKHTLHLRTLPILLLLTLLLAACGQSTAPTPTPVPAISEPTSAPAAVIASEATTATTTLTLTQTEITTDTATAVSTTETVTDTTTEPAAPVEPTAPPHYDPTTTPIVLAPVVSNLLQPLYVTHAADGSNRLFIVEKAGRIRIIQDDALLDAPFLDIVDRVGSSANEQGLLGLAFAPNYTESGYLYVNYTDKAGDSVVSRFQVSADPNVADPASESVVMQYDQPAGNHNGGMVLFGPDGMLWIGTGDGGLGGDPFEHGQNPQTILGKMLRIDVASDPSQPYTIPADNPSQSGPWSGLDVLDEIWALGLRNPWRYSFDRATGDLWIADVGQNVYEEVNFVAAGSAGALNFGWNIMEGMHCFRDETCSEDGLVLPILEYTHEGHCSVTGGYVYRGAAYPQLNGVYFYGDYCSGHVWAAYPAADGAWQNVLALESSLTLSSFGEDELGELYLVDYSGAIYRLTAQ